MKKSLLMVLMTLLASLAFAQTDKTESATGDNDAVIEEPVFTVVEQAPEYPGGMKAMSKFLSKNIKYPREALEESIQGKVIVTFIVEKDGSVSNVEVLKSVHKLLDDEAVRVVKMMPKWKPGTQAGKPVRSKFDLPILFNMQE